MRVAHGDRDLVAVDLHPRLGEHSQRHAALPVGAASSCTLADRRLKKKLFCCSMMGSRPRARHGIFSLSCCWVFASWRCGSCSIVRWRRLRFVLRLLVWRFSARSRWLGALASITATVGRLPLPSHAARFSTCPELFAAGCVLSAYSFASWPFGNCTRKHSMPISHQFFGRASAAARSPASSRS